MNQEVDKALETLRASGTLLYPTDTIWGLGCDARNGDAIEAIAALKQRPLNKSMILLIHDPSLLNKYVRDVPDVAWDLIEAQTDPMTIVYPEGINLPSQALADDGSVAIRLVQEGFPYELLRKFRAPIVSTSANISNQASPQGFHSIDPAILSGVDYVVDLPAESSGGKASSIIKIEVNGEFKILRK